MESIATILVGALLGVVLDPVVLFGTMVAVAVLASGLGARVAEAFQDARRPRITPDQAGAIRVNGNS